MPSRRNHRLLTPRDLEVLSALDLTPLTAQQLLKLSQTFSQPFTTDRRVRERVQKLTDVGWIKRHRYATTDRGALNYYTLSPVGYRILYGDDAKPPTKRYFAPIGVARQRHTRSLADFIVHTAVAAYHAGVSFTDFYRENTVRLSVRDENFYPDCAFQLVTHDDRVYRFFIELDNRTERVHSTKDVESWQRKIRLYNRYRDQSGERFFRVLVITTGTRQRLSNILGAVSQLSQNSDRSLFYGITLDEYLAEPTPVTAPCFRDHRGRSVSLLPPTGHMTVDGQANAS